jgi:magnesium and cobalt exporter, CNNM family
VEGIVTPTDILEALVGELPQTGDVEEPMIVRADESSWSIDAATDLDEVKIALGVEALDGQKEDRFQTIAGYLIDRIGHLPHIGDSTVVGDYRFQVLDMDGRRVDRVLVRKVEGKSAARG